MTEQIRTKAAEMFFSYGLKSISMDDLARSAGMSKKTLYQYYANKNELVGEVAKQLLQSHQHAFVNAASTAKDAVDETLIQSTLLATVLPSVHRSFYLELEKYYAAGWEMLVKHRDKFILPTLQKTLQRGIDEHVFRHQIDIALIAHIRLQHIKTAMLEQCFAGNYYSHAQLINQFTLFYLYAITTTKGKTLIEKYTRKTNGQ
jgi:AcrR family transcriptional regulator